MLSACYFSWSSHLALKTCGGSRRKNASWLWHEWTPISGKHTEA